jgi:rsbT antagonist protein RsbS
VARVPILKQGDILVVAIQDALEDAELDRLRADLAEKIGGSRAAGLILDVSALDVIDSYSTRTLLGIAKVARLRGVEAVIAGIQPDVAFAMVQLGLTLEGVETALDLEEGMALLAGLKRGGRGRD